MTRTACLLAALFTTAAAGQQADGGPPIVPAPRVHSAEDSPPPPPPPPPTKLSLTVGKSLIVDSVLPLERVSVGLGDFAEGTVIGPHQLLLNDQPDHLAGGREQAVLRYHGGAQPLPGG
jgi:hypothetical protein